MLYQGIEIESRRMPYSDDLPKIASDICFIKSWSICVILIWLIWPGLISLTVTPITILRRQLLNLC
jgi:hypothetical protein